VYWAAAIGVMQQRIGLAPPPDYHHQSIGDELRGHGCVHRPADHAPREQIDDGSNIEPALRRPHIGEVGESFAVGRRGFEDAVEHIRSDGGSLPFTQIGGQATPSRMRSESLQPHQSLYPMQPARHSIRQHVVPPAPGAISPVSRQEAGANLRTQFIIAPTALTARSGQPSIKATSRDTERPAQPSRRPDHPVLRDEGELRVDSFAK